MKKHMKLGIGAIVLLVVMMCWILAQKEISNVQIHFSDTDPIPGYQLKNRESPLKIAMISVLNHEDTDKYQKQLADAIGQRLHRPVLVLRRKSYAEINQLLSKGNADIGLLSTGAYCTYSRHDDFVLLAMQERNSLPYYYGYVVVLKQSRITSLEELRGKRFAYVDPLSYSGYLGLQEKLLQQAENPEIFFQSTYFTYSHDASIRAVLNDFVDGASIDSLAYDYLEKFEPDKAAQLRIIDRLPPRGTGPMVARKGLADMEHIQHVLLHLHEDPSGKAALNRLMIDRFILPQPALYPPITWREREAG